MNNIRKLRLDKGWTIRELADRMGVHFTTIARIERSERKLTFDWVYKFAQALDASPDEIIDNPFSQQVTPLRELPVIGLVAAGNWREAIRDPIDTIPVAGVSASAFGLRVSGESMNKVAPAGAVVTVEPDKIDLHDGAYYVIMNEEGDTTFKQYRSNPARLEPLSSDESYQPITLGRSPFTVIGRVTGVTIRYD